MGIKSVINKIKGFLFNLDSVSPASFHSKIIVVFVTFNILSLAPDIFKLYSIEGIVNQNINDSFLPAYSLNLNKLIELLEIDGLLSYNFLFKLFFIIYLTALILQLFDIFRLPASIYCVVFHSLILNSSYLFSYGADFMITFLLFINVFFNISIQTKSNSAVSKQIYSFTIRLLQLQLCIIYFFGGFGKTIGYDWLDGEAMWLISNHYLPLEISWILNFLPRYFFIILGLLIVYSELFYPLFVYLNYKTRKFILYDIFILHIGIGIIMNLYTFSIVMILFNLIAFYPDQTHRIFLKWKALILTKTLKTT